MSLIKSVDVPKHLADRLRSRRIAARLSGGAKHPALPKSKPLAAPPLAIADEKPTGGLLGPTLL
jgi:ABC-type glutathione transport system ATPase component